MNYSTLIVYGSYLFTISFAEISYNMQKTAIFFIKYFFDLLRKVQNRIFTLLMNDLVINNYGAYHATCDCPVLSIFLLRKT